MELAVLERLPNSESRVPLVLRQVPLWRAQGPRPLRRVRRGNPTRETLCPRVAESFAPPTDRSRGSAANRPGSSESFLRAHVWDALSSRRRTLCAYSPGRARLRRALAAFPGPDGGARSLVPGSPARRTHRGAEGPPVVLPDLRSDFREARAAPRDTLRSAPRGVLRGAGDAARQPPAGAAPPHRRHHRARSRPPARHLLRGLRAGAAGVRVRGASARSPAPRRRTGRREGAPAGHRAALPRRLLLLPPDCVVHPPARGSPERRPQGDRARAPQALVGGDGPSSRGPEPPRDARSDGE